MIEWCSESLYRGSVSVDARALFCPVARRGEQAVRHHVAQASRLCSIQTRPHDQELFESGPIITARSLSFAGGMAIAVDGHAGGVRPSMSVLNQRAAALPHGDANSRRHAAQTSYSSP